MERNPATQFRRIVGRTLGYILILELLLVYLDVTVTFYGASASQPLQDLCNLVIEGSMGGWCSSALSLCVAVTAWLIHVEDGERRRSASGVPGWAVIAVFFAFMALDDGSGLHEAIGTAFEDQYVASGTGIAAFLLHAFPSYPWQFLFAPILASGGAFTAWWSLRNLPPRSLRLLILAGLACFVLALGVDFLEGLETPYDNASRALRLDDVTIPHFSGVLEEFVEMLGTGLFLSAYIAHRVDRNEDAPRGGSRTS